MDNKKLPKNMRNPRTLWCSSFDRDIARAEGVEELVDEKCQDFIGEHRDWLYGNKAESHAELNFTFNTADGREVEIDCKLTLIISEERGWKWNRKHLIDAIKYDETLYHKVFEDDDAHRTIRILLGKHYRSVLREIDKMLGHHIPTIPYHLTPARDGFNYNNIFDNMLDVNIVREILKNPIFEEMYRTISAGPIGPYFHAAFHPLMGMVADDEG